ncbi:MAG: glutamine--fructose-6-phosphate transaminase (isomerizing) [Pseudomonadota bacterium]
MCGIVGVAGVNPVETRLLDGLSRLEYRGYDSAGLAIIDGDALKRRRAAGELSNLRAVVEASPISGLTGIAHTRWATHGRPTETNAHPHQADGVAIVHNGIIENFREIRQELEAKGRIFETETDSETIAQLIAQGMADGLSPEEAFHQTVDALEGAYAIAAVFADHPGLMLAARQGSPLVAGIEDGETFVGSDAIAIAPYTKNVVYLEEGDRLRATPGDLKIVTAAGAPANRPVQVSNADDGEAQLGNYQYFMEKEIHEQPEAIARTLAGFIDASAGRVSVDARAEALFADADRAVAVACGTAYYAAFVAKYWFESLAHLAVEVDIASEFRYRSPVLPQRGPALFISQSGETADTLAALAFCKNNGMGTIGVVNVPTSSIARETTLTLPTRAGREIGVASTKAFTAQLAALAAGAVAAARARGRIGPEIEAQLVEDLLKAPRLVGEALATETQMMDVAKEIAGVSDIFYFGRGAMYPIALEGALKLKEISYIHAEGYASGELKHGPIALIEEGTPVVVLAPYDETDGLFAKTISNTEEVIARGAKVILVTNKAGAEKAGHLAAHTITMPDAPRFIQPLVAAVPMQFLAYHTALAMNRNVDKPRNLAKSVTVE